MAGMARWRAPAATTSFKVAALAQPFIDSRELSEGDNDCCSRVSPSKLGKRTGKKGMERGKGKGEGGKPRYALIIASES
jgi:hypothetical protein